MIIVALLSTILIGIVGLSIDGGEAAGDQQLTQASADGAALAGAYSAAQGSTQAAATALATLVVTKNGVAAAGLAMNYRDQNGVPVAGPGTAGGTTVQATVTFSRGTFFLGAVGIPNFRVTASARASVPAAAAVSCAFCLMSPDPCAVNQNCNGGAALEILDSAQVTVSGAPVVVNSTADPNLTVGNGSSLTATAIRLAALLVQNSGTIRPNPTVGAAIADPFPGLAIPAVANSAGTYNSPRNGSGSIGPGIYSGIRVNGNFALTLNPGTYVLTGPLLVGGSVNAVGVTIVLACTTYPSACPSQSYGADLLFYGGPVVISAPTSGAYAGLAVIADRNNLSPNDFDAVSTSVTGTIYTLAMPLFNQQSNTTVSLQSRTIVDSTSIASTAFTVSYSAAQNYGGGGGSTIIALAP